MTISRYVKQFTKTCISFAMCVTEGITFYILRAIADLMMDHDNIFNGFHYKLYISTIINLFRILVLYN